MTRNIIEADVKRYIDQSLADGSQENPKLEFKTKWQNLLEVEGLSKFLKITSAIVNTPGLDGLIVYGYNDKDKSFLSAKLIDSGLSDSHLITGIINKNIQRGFNLNLWDTVIDGHELTIIHIPPSIDKPHMISSYKIKDNKGNVKEEKEKIFIRKGSNTVEANRFDIEFMLYDRKNILPDYQLFATINSQTSHFRYEKNKGIYFDTEICMENTGLRPISIEQIELNFLSPINAVNFDFNKSLEKTQFYFIAREKFKKTTLVAKNHKENNRGKKIGVIEPNRLILEQVEFVSTDPYEMLPEKYMVLTELYNLNKSKFNDFKIICFLHNGRIIHSNVDFLIYYERI